MKAVQILEHLDPWFTLGNFHLPPMPNDGYEDYAEMRMTVFRAPRLWAIIIELISWWADADTFNRKTYIYGNCLSEEGWIEEAGEKLSIEWTPDKLPGEWRDEKDFDLLDRANFSVVIDGQRHDFKPRAQDYEDAEIHFVHNRTGAASLSITQMLRFLCHELDHPFFASREELNRVLDSASRPRRTPLSQQMEMFLQTRDWQHPQVGDDDETPISSLEGWQVLARAIENGDLSEWQNLDALLFNTHWRFWNEGADEDKFSSDPDEDSAWQSQQLKDVHKINIIVPEPPKQEET